MEAQHKLFKSKVMRIDSGESWDNLMAQASNEGRPVVVHFTAAWCVPSVAMNPFFEELAANHQDVLFLLVDVDDVKVVASKMEVKAMSTFLLLRSGTQVHKLIGANPEEIRKRIDAFVATTRSQKV